MGDFNDTYNSKMLTEVLRVNNELSNIQNEELYNLSSLLAKKGEGSIKYRNRWQLVDMFIISGNMLKPSSNLYCSPNDIMVIKADFLLEYVPTNNNYRPKPTFRWIKYIGGYSDHLPILMQLHIKHKK